MKYNKLKAFFVEHGIKQQEVSNLLKIDRSTFSNKINRYKGADFSLDEVRIILTEYDLSSDIFFN